jgi:F-type H+-transporting ATPase subunit b
MKSMKFLRILALAALLVLASSVVFAQASIQPSAPTTPAAEASRKAPEAAPQAKSSEAKPIDTEEDVEENAQFKYAGIVQKVSKATGLSKETVYWIFVVINFAILAWGIRWVLKKAMPHGFAPRTAEIQKGIEEAKKASAEAQAKLAEIEGRLAKLDGEIAELKAAAEADFGVEEQRIKEAAEQDARHVIAAAEQEIAAAARVAQRDLKAFVADLAVGLAEKKIKVDDATDRMLVHGFATQLGKDGQ